MNHHLFTEDRFGDLWNRIVNFARLRYSDLDPEDLAATAVAKAFAANKSIEPDKLFRYLCTTVIRLAYDKLRSRLPTVPLQVEPETDDQCSFWLTSHVERLQEEIERLKPAMRVVVEMKMNRLSTTEIAQQLGVSPRTVLARYSMATAILKRRLPE